MTDSSSRARIDEFILALKRRKIVGAYRCAIGTAEVLRDWLAQWRASNQRGQTPAQQLLQDIRELGAEMQMANPVELAIGNVVRRVLYFVREEIGTQSTSVAGVALKRSVSLSGGGSPAQLAGGSGSAHGHAPPISVVPTRSMSSTLLPFPATSDVQGTDSDVNAAGSDTAGEGGVQLASNFKQGIILQIKEFIEEIMTIDTSIADTALLHIHAEDVVMTIGDSLTVRAFLKEAAKKRPFRVIVCEGAPSYQGQSLANALSQANVHTTVVPDCAIFSVMPRVTKIVVSANAVLANGGVISTAGAALVAKAAFEHRVPVIVTAGIYKLSPSFPHDPDSFNLLSTPNQVFDAGKEALNQSVEVANPSYDYIAPEFISLLISNDGNHLPSYVYRLLSDSYSAEDYTLAA